MQGEVALEYFCVLLIVGGWGKPWVNGRKMQDGLLLVAGTLCQCVNDHGEDDCGWCWCAGAELATRKRLARAACRGHSVQLSSPSRDLGGDQ